MFDFETACKIAKRFYALTLTYTGKGVIKGQVESAGKSRQRVGGESPPHGNEERWPRVMRRLPVRGRRSVDRGRVGLAIELRNHLVWVADLVIWWES